MSISVSSQRPYSLLLAVISPLSTPGTQGKWNPRLRVDEPDGQSSDLCQQAFVGIFSEATVTRPTRGLAPCHPAARPLSEVSLRLPPVRAPVEAVAALEA